MKSKTISMKVFIGFIIVFLNSAIWSQEFWQTDFKKTAELAKAQNKPILMVFAGSDWCKPCIRLTKEVFETDSFQKFARENLVLLRLDFPRARKNRLTPQQIRHNEQLADEYNKNGDFPLVLLLSPQKEVLATTGYRRGGAQKYIEHLKSLMPQSPRTAVTDGAKE